MWRLRPSGTSVLFAVLSVLSACGGDGTEEPTDTASTSDVSSDTTPMSDALDDTALDDTQGPIPDAVGDATDTAVPPATCTDGVVNGAETGVDCGGGACPDCGDAQACGSDSDCASNYCEGSTCKGDVELTITAIQQDASSVDCVSEVASLVTWPDVKIRGVVTAPVRSLSGGLSGTYLGGATSAPDGGVQLVWSGGVSAAGVEPGAVVAVTGSVNEFFCNTQLVATAIEVVSDGAAPAPRVATPAEVQAEAWEGTLIRLEGVAISDSSTVGSGYVTLAGGLQLQLGDFGVTVEEGTAALAWVVGVVKYSFGDYRVAVIAVGLGPCDPDPCLNGGACAPDGAGFACTCAAGYEGETCATDIDECDPNPCPSGGACWQGVGSFTCEGDSCAHPWLLMADGDHTWSGSGDTSAVGMTDAMQSTACDRLGVLEADGPATDEVWTFQAPADGDYRVTITPDSADLFVHAYVGAACGGGCYGYVDSANEGAVEHITVPDVTQGTDITVVVDGWEWAATGVYAIAAERSACPGHECGVVASDLSAIDMAFDGAGRPAFLHRGSYNGGRLARCGSATCASGTTTEALMTDTGGVWNTLSLAFSPGVAGAPVVAWSIDHGPVPPVNSYQTVQISRIGSVGGNAIEVEHVAGSLADQAGSPSLAVHADGNLVVAYTRFGADKVTTRLEVAKCGATDESCFVPIWVYSGNVSAPQLEIGGDGNPVILFTEGETTKLLHCTTPYCADHDLPSSVFTAPGARGSHLTIGPNGLPIIAQGAADGAIAFLVCGDAACTPANIASQWYVLGIDQYIAPYVAVRASGQMMVAYRSDAKLKLAVCETVACSAVAVFTLETGWTSGLAIAIGPDDQPLVSYIEDGTLKARHVILP